MIDLNTININQKELGSKSSRDNKVILPSKYRQIIGFLEDTLRKQSFVTCFVTRLHFFSPG
jgi:hypothetical protein